MSGCIPFPMEHTASHGVTYFHILRKLPSHSGGGRGVWSWHVSAVSWDVSVTLLGVCYKVSIIHMKLGKQASGCVQNYGEVSISRPLLIRFPFAHLGDSSRPLDLKSHWSSWVFSVSYGSTGLMLVWIFPQTQFITYKEKRCQVFPG